MAPSSTATSSKGTLKKGASTVQQAAPDLFECFYDPKICEIPPTSNVPKPDAFDLLRPKPRTVLDYKISQTDTKMQKKLATGIAKVHVEQTTATYVLPPPGYVFPEEDPPPPPPPPPTPVVYFSGRSPVWEFLEDKHRRKVEVRQKIYNENLTRLIASTKRYEKNKKKNAHTQLMKLVGPDWYQELSPKQLKTVDNLKNCIVKDLKLKTIIHTQENIAELGLVLRPDPRHIQMALNQCCECPVEFLLILYQLMNRHRVKYSLNDRLLLSGVVHLTMRETLKELHVRIPSPPPVLKKLKPYLKIQKKKRYKSPYLVPFTFVPEPPKHTGIYENQHIQYPESPYFSYISELKAETAEAIVETGDRLTIDGNPTTKIVITKIQSGISEEQEKEIVAELRLAQEEYNNLAQFPPAPYLRKPLIYIPCDHGMKKIRGAGREEEKELSSPDIQTQMDVSIKMKMDIINFESDNQQVIKTCQCKITFDETKVRRQTDVESSSSSSHLNYSVEELIQSEKSPALPKEIPTKNIGIVTDNIAKQINITDSQPSTEDKVTTKSENKVELQESKSDTVKSDIFDEQLVAVGQRESNECKCKEEVAKILETNFCQCDKCKADRSERDKWKTSAKIISVLELNQADKEECEESQTEETKQKAGCDCFEKYQAKVKMYEEMKKRFDVQHDLMTLQQQYIISGVSQGPNGPVYMLSGVRPQYGCRCAEYYKEQLKEKNRLANMPKELPGNPKYVISGVRETPQGNVYIVSGAVTPRECSCMKMYKKYQERHSTCLEAYQQYLKKIETDKKEYMEELACDGRFEDIKLTEEVNVQENEQQEIGTLNESKKSDDIPDEKQETSKCKSQGCNNTQTGSDRISESREGEKICPCGAPKESEDNKYDEGKDEINSNECICVGPSDCICGGDHPLVCECESESGYSSDVDIASSLKRFVILDKIPCQRAKQIEILKKALAGLAEDGYPLAKLPDSYKLPHFKLWMRLRCGQFWTQKDRVNLLVQSWLHWRHISYCGQKVKEKAKLNLSKEKAALYTWAHAKTVREIAAEKDNTYYRQLRQAVIGDAREFFPSTFSYELPTPNFRDCFFAYTPAKEEHCIAWRPWYPHEIKILRKT